VVRDHGEPCDGVRIPVFAVPGDADRETSVGCNLLIPDGGRPVFDSDDLIEVLALLLGSPAAVG
jgi:predicted Rossmann fold nucleotide-binding protein DprA/Smf involved in DNA uptake